MVLNFTRYPNSLIFMVPEHCRRNKIYLLTYNKTISLRSYLTGRHFKNAQLKSIIYPFCRNLRGNQIKELPTGVFSNNNKLFHLWVGRLKVHSRPSYFYCKILLQILVNSKICKDFGSFKNRDVLLHFCSIKGLHICIRIMFRL